MKRLSKKLFALIASVCVIFTAMTVPAFAAFGDLTADNPVYITKAEGNITATVVFDNSGTAEASGKFILAQYEGGVLKDAAVSDVTVPAGGINSATVSAVELAGAEVKCFVLEKTKLTPLKTAVNPADGTAALTNILVDGEPLTGFNTDTTTYSIAASSSKVPVVEGIPADAENTVVTTSYSEGGGKSITATVKSESTISDDEVTYEITFTLLDDGEPNPHVVVGAASDSDFTNVEGTKFGEELLSNTQVATSDVYNLTDVTSDQQVGYLRKNLHSFENAEGVLAEAVKYSAIPEGYTASRMYVTAGADAVNFDWAVYQVNDPALVGADYFCLGTNVASARFGDVWYDGTSGKTVENDITDKTTLLEFEINAPATVHIITTAVAPEYASEEGYTYTNKINGQPIIMAAQTTLPRYDRNFDHKYSKNFDAGTVTIPYRTSLNSSRTPIIVVTPQILVFDNPYKNTVITNFKNYINGLSYEDYCAYAGETVVDDETLKTGLGTYDYNVAPQTNFSVGSLVGANTQRTVAFINPAFDLEGLEYINFDNSYTNPRTGGEKKVNWLVEAFSGKPTCGMTDGAEAKDNYGFTKTVPWASFDVAEDCDVIVIARGDIPAFEENGYVKSQLSDTAIIVNRTNGEVADNYKTMYVKSFEAGQTVDLYNFIDGFNEHVVFIRPTGN